MEKHKVGSGQAPAGKDKAGKPAVPPIGREEVLQARQTLDRYRAGKANLERRIVENEQWYKLRHWGCMAKEGRDAVEPVSGWLFNALANKHADAMDNFPTPNILPREAGDREAAQMLSAIVPVVLEQNEFEDTYDHVWDYKLKAGTGVYGVFWDSRKLNGLGDIAIKKVDVLNLFWESGITDIQDSRNLFHVQLCDDDLLLQRYPFLEGRLGGEDTALCKYLYDDTVDCTGKSAVVDWYYKKNGALHFCKFVGDTVLFATENEGMDRWYDHGQYPFVFDPLFPVEGTPCGFGYIDIGKSAQEYIDRGNQAILKNLLANVRPRHFVRADGSVNEQEYADLTRDFVHVDGQLGQDSILPIQGKPLSGIYVEVINHKIDELKEVTGNRDISTGGTSSGVTAASAIAAMQEAGSKLSRDHNRASYRAFRKVVLMVIELIRQFYDSPRCFRILGSDGAEQYVTYSGAALQPKPLDGVFGGEAALRMPVFDVQVSAQKQNPYSKMSQNELALQFYGAGFFDPARAEQALACLEMMEFEGKQLLMRRLRENGQRLQQRMIRQSMAAMEGAAGASGGVSGASGGVSGASGGVSGASGGAEGGLRMLPALGGSVQRKESHGAKKARQRVAESTNPT